MFLPALHGTSRTCDNSDTFRMLVPWQPASSAPFDRDLELAVIDRTGTHALVFRCRRAQAGWINARTGRRVDIDPTHWREWLPDRGW